MMGMDLMKTQEMIDSFDEICRRYAVEDIDPSMLRKGVLEIIDKWC